MHKKSDIGYFWTFSGIFGQPKKSTNPNFCGSDIFRWGGGLPSERVGAKKFRVCFATPRETKLSGKEETNKHKHFRRDGVRDKQEPSLGQMGPLPGTKWDPSLGQTGLSLFNSTVKSPFCPVCPWDGWGFVPGTIVPQWPSEKCLCVLCSWFFLAPKLSSGIS